MDGKCGCRCFGDDTAGGKAWSPRGSHKPLIVVRFHGPRLNRKALRGGGWMRERLEGWSQTNGSRRLGRVGEPSRICERRPSK